MTLPLDADACAAEPIRIPGGIQPHGALLALHPETLVLLQHSANAEARLGLSFAPGTPIPLPPDILEWARDGRAALLARIDLPMGRFHLSGHHTAQAVILEFEPLEPGEAASSEHLPVRLQSLADEVLPVKDLRALGTVIAAQIRALTGFNRVLVYAFDAEWHGTVIAESNDGVLPSYLDLRFPASDIPAQARELYRLNPLRIIPDAGYRPVPLVPTLSPIDGRPLDLGFAGLRSVSPVHLQYMRNMGTAASMSVSILVDGALWGLISCHNASPRRVSPEIRSACNFIGRILSLQIAAIERGRHAEQRIRLKRRETDLLARLSGADDMPRTLLAHEKDWLGLTEAAGAAVVTEKGVWTAGETPPPEAIENLAGALRDLGRDSIATDRLSTLLPDAIPYADAASGLLAISISQLHPSFVMWFRPEVVRTVAWGGDPRKPADPAERLSPRASFDQWKEEVRRRANPWTEAEIETAEDFRVALINFVLRRAEERAALNEELERSNRELEAFSYSVSHDLRAPFRHIVGYAELLSARESTLDEKSRHYLSAIGEAAVSAGRLVDDLLSFSQLGRMSVEKNRIDMNKLVLEVRRALEPDLAGRAIEWRVGTLPAAWGDPALIRQALANLIENAAKYSRERTPAVITIEGALQDGQARYTVSDNGIGFEMDYVHKLFGVFQRLHRMEDFPGTGIGLALTKRIVNRHGGSVSARGAVNQGASFTFTLPALGEKQDIA